MNVSACRKLCTSNGSASRLDVDQAKSEREIVVLGIIDAEETLLKRKRVLGEMFKHLARRSGSGSRYEEHYCRKSRQRVAGRADQEIARFAA